VKSLTFTVPSAGNYSLSATGGYHSGTLEPGNGVDSFTVKQSDQTFVPTAYFVSNASASFSASAHRLGDINHVVYPGRPPECPREIVDIADFVLLFSGQNMTHSIPPPVTNPILVTAYIKIGGLRGQGQIYISKCRSSSSQTWVKSRKPGFLEYPICRRVL
jgi:hypothetical protein